jgi:hypothetical protein
VALKHSVGSNHNDKQRTIVMATPPYRERMKAARAEASAKPSKKRIGASWSYASQLNALPGSSSLMAFGLGATKSAIT